MPRTWNSRKILCCLAVWSGCLLLILSAGCASHKYLLAPDNALPDGGKSWDIRQSPYFQELKAAYGKDDEYERAKIKYLLGHTRISPYKFVRNGCEHDAAATEKHLRKKYLREYESIVKARDFINQIASASSASGRSYLALPGDGNAYPTGTILLYELERVEEFMDREMNGG